MVIFFDGVAHTDGCRLYIAVTLVHLHTQKELDRCEIFSEIYDHFLKIMTSFKAWVIAKANVKFSFGVLRR